MRLFFGVRLALAGLVFAVPVLVSAQIEITEIAWMGTAVSANDEWIELRNSGSESVSLSGWTLSAADGTPSITLSGSIGADEYKLLERTDDTTYPGMSALVIFTGALGNEGETLALKQGSATIQTLSFAGGWPAGDVATKKTMQWTGSAWVTADETAGSVTTASGDEEQEEGEEEEEETGGEEEEETDEEDDETIITETSSGNRRVVTRKKYDEMIFEIDFPSRAVAGDPSEFHAQALDFYRDKLRKGEYVFNMGDGTTRTSSPDWHKSGSGFSHTYEHPGKYHITIDYYLTRFEDSAADVSDTFTIEVVPADIAISRILPDGGIEMKNNSSSAVDLSGWKLSDASGNSFTIPDGSAILASSTVVFSQKVTRLSPFAGVTLATETGSLAATSVQPKKVSSGSKSSIVAKEAGEVLGASTSLAVEVDPVTEPTKQKGQSVMVWILLFVILTLVAVIAMLLLRKEERDGQYVLVEE